MWKMDFVLSIKLRRRKVPNKLREVFYFLGMVYTVVANLRLHEFIDPAVWGELRKAKSQKRESEKSEARKYSLRFNLSVDGISTLKQNPRLLPHIALITSMLVNFLTQA
jgi:hypothetical protein